MGKSHFEKQLKKKYDSLKEMESEESKNKDFSNLSKEELIFKITKLKYEYFRKGYLICMLSTEK